MLLLLDDWPGLKSTMTFSMISEVSRAYMGGHIVQAFVYTRKHLREFGASDKASGSWSVESPGDRLQVVVELEVEVQIICQVFQPFLFLHKAFTLLLKRCRLRLHLLERISQFREQA